MKGLRNILLIICFFFTLSEAFSQSKSIKVGIEFPYQLSIGYENQFHEWFSFYGQFGVMTIPMNYPLLWQMRLNGLSKDAGSIIENIIDFGTVAGFGTRYYFNKYTVKNYVGPFIFYANNYTSRNISDYDVSKHFGVDMTNFPIGPIPKSMSTNPLSVNSKFIQIGLQYGYRIPTSRADREIRLEVNISKNIWSRHRLESDYRYFGDFRGKFDDELSRLYFKHANIITMNFYYIFKTDYKRF